MKTKTPHEQIAEALDDARKYMGRGFLGDQVDLHKRLIQALTLLIRNEDLERWQPIETAPKDGTLIDLWQKHEYGECRLTNARWQDSDYHGGGPCWEYLGLDTSGGYGEIDWVKTEGVATHWMPLPNPPEIEAVKKMGGKDTNTPSL